MKTIIDTLKKIDLTINVDYTSNLVYVEKSRGSIFFGFVAHYVKTLKDYQSSSRDLPEEYSLDFEITNITDLEIYVMQHMIVDEKEIEKALDYLKKELIGKKISK